VAGATTPGSIDSLVLWAPIANGRRYARELRAFSQVGADPAQGGVGGFAVAPDTLGDIERIDLAKLNERPACRVLIIPRDDLPETDTLSAPLTELGAKVQVTPAAGYADALVEPHRTSVPDGVIGAIVSWLNAAHPQESRTSPPPRPQTHESVVLDDIEGADTALITEHALFLDARARIFGVFSKPVRDTPRETGIVLVNAGAISRVGPQRLYVTMAREWAAKGFRVLRMDIGGIGDSRPAPGAIENETYPPAAVDDIMVGIDALRRAGCKRVVVAGLCSGAHAAFHLAIERPGIPDLGGVILINPIVFYWKPGDALDVSAWQNYVDSQRYRRRAWSSDAWRKLIHGEVNFGAVAQTFIRRGVTLASAAVTRVRARFNPSGKEDLARDLVGITERSVNLKMIFSEGDPGFDQLNLYARHVLGTLRNRPEFDVSIIQDADHTFTQIDAQRRVRADLAEYLTTRFA
jgi:hypothetical protein